MTLTRLLAAPVWRSGFRPFFLGGAIYGPLALAAWLVALSAPPGVAVPPTVLWHGHEMLFGFAAAIVAGFVLTALPSWAGTPEVSGGRLMVLAALWLAGRMAMWGGAGLWPALAAGVDLLLVPVLLAMIAPGLLAAVDRRFAVLLPILAAMAAGNAVYHGATLAGDHVLAHRALVWSTDVLVVLFAVVGGFLTPVFTRTTVAGLENAVVASPAIERLAGATLLLWVAADTMVPDSWPSGIAAAAAAVAHGMRLWGWRGWRTGRVPVLWVTHVAYLWLVLALALQALSDLGAPWPGTVALHAFTVGALGLMMMGLMSRVVLRHTGRPVQPGPLMVAAFWVMMLAAPVRVAAGILADDRWLAVSALLWGLPFIAYLFAHGAFLVRPSLPREAAPER
ncbi:MAG: NnrS family protein [Rhodospirillales bacterium]|nr:NnrS family protein [Rhodospirillales bacterium]